MKSVVVAKTDDAKIFVVEDSVDSISIESDESSKFYLIIQIILDCFILKRCLNPEIFTDKSDSIEYGIDDVPPLPTALLLGLQAS